MVPMSVLCAGDAVAEQLTLVNDQLDQLVVGQAVLAEQHVEMLRFLAAAEPVNPDRLYSRADAARLLDVHTRTIDRWIKAGLLVRSDRGRRCYITGRSIRERHSAQTQRTAMEVLKL